MADDVVVLNVGGVLYTTTRATLTKYPSSMLGAMFSGHFVMSYDSEGHHFIDRDGDIFRHVLNFLRSNVLSVPQGFKDYDLLEAEADFYQIIPLIEAIKEQRVRESTNSGYFIEFLEFEETACFYRFYSNPPRGSNRDMKTGGLVISGDVAALRTLPLPPKTLQDLDTSGPTYRRINVNSSLCSKMQLVHSLSNNGWELKETSFANNTDTDGSYIIHKYLWFLPTL